MMRCEFNLVLDHGAADYDPDRERWHVKAPCPVFNLVPKLGDLPSGWVLIEGRLVRQGDACAAELLVFGDKGFAPEEVIVLPVLPNGRIHEIVYLPPGGRRLGWRPIASDGWFEQPIFSMRPLGFRERWWRMVNRVVDTLISQPRTVCSSYGLTPWRAVVDLPGAYEAATLFRIHRHRIDYQDWIERFDTLNSKDVTGIRRAIHKLPDPSHFRVWVVTADKSGRLAITLESLRRQLYRNFSVTVFDWGESLGRALEQADLDGLGMGARLVGCHQAAAALAKENDLLGDQPRNDWVMIVRAGDVLPPHSLYWFAATASEGQDAAMIYADDDVLDEKGRRCLPRFKPDWSPEHLRSANYLGDAVCFRSALVSAAGGVPENCLRLANDDLLLRLTEGAAGQVIHIPAILLHRHRYRETGEAATQARAARESHFKRLGIAASVRGTLPGCFRIRYPLEGQPLVSIIVPTRDGLHLLRRCIGSVLNKSSYRNFEVIVVDNGSVEQDTLTYLSELGADTKVRVLRDDGPFNFSGLNNRAVRESAGAVVCLLNNDTEVISPDWLEEMLSHLFRDRVGAVGAKLYFPDGRVQHAGDAVGPGGCADHLHGVLEGNDPGYCNRAILAQEVSAVTGACLMTHRWLFEKIGGLDEIGMKVAFNDVDYCLKVQEAGYRVVFTPHAELYHYESASRGRDDSPEKLRRTRREADQMRKRWRERMKHDPYYNPNLSYRRPDFSLGDIQKVRKPWL